MAKTARELIEEESTEGRMMKTEAQIEIMREAARELDASPSEISRNTGYAHQTVTNTLRKATMETIKENAVDILDVNSEDSKHVTNIYIFSDMDEEEVLKVLRITDEH